MRQVVDRSGVATALAGLGAASGALRTAVLEDRPELTGDRALHKVIRDLVEAVDDLDTRVQESCGDAEGLRLAAILGVLRGADQGIRRLLSLREGALPRARSVVARWGPEWLAWSEVVCDGVADVDDALTTAQAAFDRVFLPVLAEIEERV